MGRLLGVIFVSFWPYSAVVVCNWHKVKFVDVAASVDAARGGVADKGESNGALGTGVESTFVSVCVF